MSAAPAKRAVPSKGGKASGHSERPDKLFNRTQASTSGGDNFGEGERLSKRVAQMLGCSRREAEQTIEGGWVRVDGQVVEIPQQRVLTQTVTVDPDASLMALGEVTLILHKPPNVPDGVQDEAGLLGAARATQRIQAASRARPPRTPGADARRVHRP